MKKTKLDKYFKAVGQGAFRKLEYDDSDNLILRTADVKASDMSGTVRLYFNNKREQMLTGRRFDPLGSGLILLRPGMFYRVYTQIEIPEPLPDGFIAKIVLGEDIEDIMAIMSDTLRDSFSGLVSFTVQPFRKVEIEKMTSLASLAVYSSRGVVFTEPEQSKSKKRKSDGTKKSAKSEDSEMETSPESEAVVEEALGENSSSNERSDSIEE